MLTLPPCACTSAREDSRYKASYILAGTAQIMCRRISVYILVIVEVSLLLGDAAAGTVSSCTGAVGLRTELFNIEIVRKP